MPRRRMRRAQGSVEEVIKGKKYRLRYWATEDERGYMRHSKTVRGTRKQAEARLAAILAEHTEDGPAPTVGVLWERYARPDFDHQLDLGDLSVQTREQYESAWRCHVQPRWADVTCDAVDPLEIQQWVDEKTLSQAKQALSLLRKVMRFAVLYRYVMVNPCDARIKLPSQKTVARRDGDIWQLDGLRQLWAVAWGQWWEPAFLLAAFGGCRVGESLGPLASEVERRGDVTLVWVTHQVNTRGSYIDRLKNEWSRRAVIVPGPMGERLWELAQDGRHFLTDDGLGSYVRQRTLQNAFRDAVGAAGLPVHPYKNLRKDWETWAHWTLRLPSDVSERLMGHIPSGSRVTATHYDKPMWYDMADVVSQAYQEHPFADAWTQQRAPAEGARALATV